LKKKNTFFPLFWLFTFYVFFHGMTQVILSTCLVYEQQQEREKKMYESNFS
jgi:cytoskeletal protein RodZ